MPARLKAGRVSVSYSVPGPPLIPQYTAASHEAEFAAFLGRAVPGLQGSLKRSDTSSATLPTVSWPSSGCSLDRLSSASGGESAEAVQGPVILLGENFEPQVMTEECWTAAEQRLGGDSSCSTGSSSCRQYATFLPDSEVGIVCNEFTRLETETSGEEESSEARRSSAEESEVGRAWTSHVRLPSLLDFWESKNRESRFTKYASESNIFDNSHPVENGLRKIPKEKNFTSCEESFPDSDDSVRSGYEDHIYEKIDAPPQYQEESGFFSYENNSSFRFTAEIREIAEEPSDWEDDISSPSAHCVELVNSDDSDNHVTVIAVDSTSATNNHQHSVRDLTQLFEAEAKRVMINEANIALRDINLGTCFLPMVFIPTCFLPSCT